MGNDGIDGKKTTRKDDMVKSRDSKCEKKTNIKMSYLIISHFIE